MRRPLRLLLAVVSSASLVVLTAGFQTPGAKQIFLKQGFDDFSHTLSMGKVIWNQPQSGLLQVTYVLEGARPYHTYQVGIHLYPNNDNEFWDDFGSEGWEDNARTPRAYSCREEQCTYLNAWEFGFLTTDGYGDGAAHFNLHPNIGTFRFQFTVRNGTCTWEDHSGCGVAFESGGIYTSAETVIIPE